MDGTIGEIRLFAADFAPKSWQYCNGALLAIRSNTALFSILGTTYGGDGQTTFGLPNLAGRSVVGVGQGPGLSANYKLGNMAGTNSVQLTTANLPAHIHAVAGSIQIPAYSDEGNSSTPANNILASKGDMYNQNSNSTTKPFPLTLQIGDSGGNNALTFVQPSLGMNYIICINGVFPSRG